MPYPKIFLMCPPDHFQVVDVKNEFMEGNQGNVDAGLARTQWEKLAETFTELGIKVETIDAQPGLEDMVFCANQTFIGLSQQKRVCVPSHMRFPSRRKEVPWFESWFSRNGYEIKKMASREVVFEGGGDILLAPRSRFDLGGSRSKDRWQSLF